MNHRRPLVLALTSAALAVGVSACGGSSAASSSSTTAPATATSMTTSSSASTAASSGGSAGGSSSGASATTKLSISAAKSGALMFDAKTLKAKAGTVVITFTNTSPEAHNLTLVKGSNGPQVGATPTFDGGSKTFTVHLSAGTYTYYCSVPGHRQGGMQGTLTVS